MRADGVERKRAFVMISIWNSRCLAYARASLSAH